MTKKYFCDFCGVHIQNNVQIRKKHNEGLVHQQNQAAYYKIYKSGQQILDEERQKTPCSRFLTNRCNFGGMCRFSHYTEEQLRGIELQIRISQDKEKEVRPITKTIEDFLEERKRKVKSTEEDLPPSLRKRKIENTVFNEWG